MVLSSRGELAPTHLGLIPAASHAILAARRAPLAPVLVLVARERHRVEGIVPFVGGDAVV